MKSGRQPPQPCNIPKSNTEVRMGILFVDPVLNFNHCKESQFESHVMYLLAVTRQPDAAGHMTSDSGLIGLAELTARWTAMTHRGVSNRATARL